MNFTDAGTDSTRIGGKSPDRKSNMQGEAATGSSSVDKAAMDMATKAQERFHHDEETNSSNTTFSK